MSKALSASKIGAINALLIFQIIKLYKMKNLLLILMGGVLLLSSCSENINDNKKADQTLYVINSDSSVIVYKHDSKEPIILTKPITLEILKKFSIPYDVIISSEKNNGIRRYIEGENNDYYEVDFRRTFLILLLLFLFISIGLLMIFKNS